MTLLEEEAVELRIEAMENVDDEEEEGADVEDAFIGDVDALSEAIRAKRFCKGVPFVGLDGGWIVGGGVMVLDGERRGLV